MHFIDLQRFNEIIQTSCIGLEFIEMLSQALDKNRTRKAKYLAAQKSDPEDAEKMARTISSLKEGYKF